MTAPVQPQSTPTRPAGPAGPPPGPPRLARTTRGASLGRRALDAGAPPKAFDHTGYADETTLALGAVAHLTHTPPLWILAAGVFAMFGAWHWSWTKWEHRGVTLYAMLVTACATAWVWWAAMYTPWSWGSLGLLAAGTFALGPVYAALRWKTDKRNEKAQIERAAANAEVKKHKFIRILEAAGAPDITIDDAMDGDVAGATWVKGERQFPAGFSLALNLGRKSPDATGLATRVPEIEKIASAETRYPIRPGSIQVHPNPAHAHKCELIVPTRDVLAETIPLPERPGPGTCHEPFEVAVSVDGSALAWDCHRDPHAMVAGMTDSGKTKFMDAHIFETTRAPDSLTWLIAGAKPARALNPWLRAFLEGAIGPDGHPVNPVVDWFAANLYEAAAMVIDATVICERRQASVGITGHDRWQATPEAPAIFIFLDESPKFLASNRKFENHRDEMKTFSELWLDLETVARSEDVHLFYLTQRGTVSMNGGDAGDIKSQTSYRAGFHATGIIDANAVFNTITAGVNVESLSQGCLYLEMTGFSRPVLAKGYYADRDRIYRASVEHAQYCGTLDSWTADPDPSTGYEGLYFYHERWTRDHQQEFLRQLCPNPVRTVPGAPCGVRSAPKSAPAEATPEGSFMDGFQAWAEANHAGEEITDQLLQDYISDAWSSATDEEKAAFKAQDIDQRAADVAALDALYDLEYQPAPPPEPAVGFNPTLPEDTRKLLEVLAGADLLLSDVEYVPSRDLLALVVDKLGWESSSTTGGRRIAKALRAVNVLKVEPRPRIDGQLTIAYRVADLRAAVDLNRKGDA